MEAVKDNKMLDVDTNNSVIAPCAIDTTSNIICSINYILNELIDKIIVIDDDEIKQTITEIASEKCFEVKDLSDVLRNTNFAYGDVSSSNTSTDTIRNKSNSSNFTICSNNESLSTDNSKTTLKLSQDDERNLFYSNFMIPLTSKCDIHTRKNNEQVEETKEVTENRTLDTDEKLLINVPSRSHIQVAKSKSSLNDIVTPYKTDCISVALVQLERNHIVTTSKEKIKCSNNYKDPVSHNNKSFLTSEICNENKNSDATLVGPVFSGFSSSNDERLQCNGSNTNQTDDSMFSLTSRSQFYSSTDEKLEDFSEKPNLTFNVVPTTSNVSYVTDKNRVIISDDMHKLHPLISKGDGQQFMDKLTQNFIKKTFDLNENFQKNVNVTLPNEATIKEILIERENLQKLSCSEESRNFQTFPDIWEKISVTLDLAIKRLEESLSDKILNELKTTLHKIEHFVNQISLQKLNESGDINAVEKAESNNDEGMQCNIIQSYVIDNLMFKLSEEGYSERSARTKVIKVKHPKHLPDTFEVLKAYSKPVSIPTADGDSLKVSSGESEISTQSRRRLLFHGPMRFLRENTVVLSSVPAFFVYMLVIYGFVVLVVKV